MTTTNETTICGCGIQHDLSGGRGHCWRTVSADDIPASIAEEIAAEIIDGQESCEDYVATNGQHYRW